MGADRIKPSREQPALESKVNIAPEEWRWPHAAYEKIPSQLTPGEIGADLLSALYAEMCAANTDGFHKTMVRLSCGIEAAEALSEEGDVTNAQAHLEAVREDMKITAEECVDEWSLNSATKFALVDASLPYIEAKILGAPSEVQRDELGEMNHRIITEIAEPLRRILCDDPRAPYSDNIAGHLGEITIQQLLNFESDGTAYALFSSWREGTGKKKPKEFATGRAAASKGVFNGAFDIRWYTDASLSAIEVKKNLLEDPDALLSAPGINRVRALDYTPGLVSKFSTLALLYRLQGDPAHHGGNIPILRQRRQQLINDLTSE